MIAFMYDLAPQAARQMKVARERLTRIERAIWPLTISIRPARVIEQIAAFTLGPR